MSFFVVVDLKLFFPNMLFWVKKLILFQPWEQLLQNVIYVELQQNIFFPTKYKQGVEKGINPNNATRPV